MKELEKELLEEKKMNEEFEEKVRVLRKARNKARLKTEKESRPKKRMKMEDSSYISIRETWGPPPRPTRAPEKTKAEENPEDPKKQRNEKKIRLCHPKLSECEEGGPPKQQKHKKIGQWGTPDPPSEVENPASQIKKYKG